MIPSDDNPISRDKADLETFGFALIIAKIFWAVVWVVLWVVVWVVCGSCSIPVLFNSRYAGDKRVSICFYLPRGLSPLLRWLVNSSTSQPAPPNLSTFQLFNLSGAAQTAAVDPSLPAGNNLIFLDSSRFILRFHFESVGPPRYPLTALSKSDFNCRISR